jgi:hypothetical protein
MGRANTNTDVIIAVPPPYAPYAPYIPVGRAQSAICRHYYEYSTGGVVRRNASTGATRSS